MKAADGGEHSRGGLLKMVLKLIINKNPLPKYLNNCILIAITIAFLLQLLYFYCNYHIFMILLIIFL